jgi:hypothetical protein
VTPPAPAEPTPELQAKVRKLVVTACVAGSQPRAVIGGKVYHPGDFVTPELLLQEIRRDRLILRDAAGVTYEKHF